MRRAGLLAAAAVIAMVATAGGATAQVATSISAETQSRTTTVVTITTGATHGSLDTANWSVTDGTATPPIASIVPLDSGDMPVTASTAVPGTPATVAQADAFEKVLITHDPLSSTAATPTIAYVQGTLTTADQGDGMSGPLPAGSTTASDGAPPELEQLYMMAGNVNPKYQCASSTPDSECTGGLTDHADRGAAVTLPDQTPTERGSRPDSVAVIAVPTEAVGSPTLTFFPGLAHSSTATHGQRDIMTANLQNFTLATVPAAASGPFTFSLPLSDSAGNSATYTHADLTGHRVARAGSALEVLYAEFEDTLHAVVKFNKRVIGSNEAGAGNAPSTLQVTVTPPGGTASAMTATVYTSELRVQVPGTGASNGDSYAIALPAMTGIDGSTLAAHTVTATYDTTAPTVSSVTPAADGTSLTVGFSEPMRAPSVESPRQFSKAAPARAFSLAVPDGAPGVTLEAAWAGGETNAATLTPTPRLSVTGSYTLSADPVVRDANGVSVGASVTSAFMAAPVNPFTYTAETQSTTSTLLTFEADLSGSLDAGTWSLADDGGEALDVTSVEARTEAGAVVATATEGSPVTLTQAGVRALLLGHDALSSAASTPGVTHTRPATAPAGGHLSGNSMEVTQEAVEASDGAAPEAVSWGFALGSGDRPRIRVMFDEGLADLTTLSSVAAPHLYAGPTGTAGSIGVGSIETATTVGDCLFCLLAVRYSSTLAEGTYYFDLEGISDTLGNARGEGRLRVTYDLSAPVVSSSIFSGTRTIHLDFDDGLDVEVPLSASNFAVTAPDNTVKPDDADTDADVIALAATGPVAYDAASSAVTLRLAADAVDGVVYTVTPSSIRNEGRTAYAGGAVTATYSPIFSAQTVARGTTLATFTSPVTATFAASEWAISDSDASMAPRGIVGVSADRGTPRPTHSLSAGTVLQIRHALLDSTASTPAVSYTVPGGGLEIGGVSIPAGGTWTVTSADRMPPTYDRIELDADGAGARAYVGEALDPDLAGVTFTASTRNPFVFLRQAAPPSITLEASGVEAAIAIDPPLKSGTYVLELGPLRDAAGNAIGGGSTRIMFDSPAPEVASAMTTSLRTTVVTLDEAVSGTLRAEDWSVADDDDGDAMTDESRAVVSVRSGSHSAAEAESARATTVELAAATSFTLTHAALSSSASTPEVSYARPASLGTGEAYLADADAPPGPYRLDSHPVVTLAGSEPTPHAADGVAPAILSARTTSVTSLEVTLSEGVTGTTEAAHWTVDGDNPDGAAVSGSTVTLTYGAEATSFAPTVVYTRPESGGLDDAAGLPLPSGMAGAGDGVLPAVESWEFGSTGALSITFGEELNSARTLANSLGNLYSTPALTTVANSNSFENVVADGDMTCTACVSFLRFHGTIADGVYYIALSGIEDANGNAYASGSLRVVRDTTAPAVSSTSFTGTRTILVDFDDVLDTATPLAASNFAVTAPDNTNKPDDADTDADTIRLAGTDPVSYDISESAVTLTLAGDAVPGVEYTVTPSSITNEVGLAYAGGAVTATYAPPFSARTQSLGSTQVTFTSAVSATFASGEWGVADSDAQATARVVAGLSAAGGDPMATHELSSATVLEISHADLESTASTPAITYTVPTGGLTVGTAALPAGGTWVVRAADGVPPEFVSWEFPSARELVLTFSEDLDHFPTIIANPGYLYRGPTGSSPSHTNDHREVRADAGGTCATCAFYMRFHQDAFANTLLYAELRGATDRSGNAHGQARIPVSRDTTPPTFTTSVGGSGFLRTITVTFSEPIFLAAGKSPPAAGDWELELEAPPTRVGQSATPVMVRLGGTPSWSPAEPTATTPATSVTLTLPPPARSVQSPVLSFSPSGEASRGSLVDAGRNALPPGTARPASDADPPRLVAATLESPTEIRARFSEAVELTAAAFDASDWSSAGTEFAGARASGEEVILAVTRSQDPTAVADGATLAYLGDSVTDIAGNAAVVSGADAGDKNPAPLADSAPPRFSFTVSPPSTLSVTLTEGATGAVAASEWRVDLTPDDPSDNTDASRAWVTPASVSVGGTEAAGGTALEVASAATAISLTLPAGTELAAGAGPSLSYVGATGMSAGTLSDAAGNAMRTGTGAPVADTTPPRVLSAAFAGEATIAVEFDEPVTVPASGWTLVPVAPATGTFTVTGATGPTEASARLAIDPAATAGATYTLGIPATLADRAGPNAIGATEETITYTAPFGARTQTATTTLVTFAGALSGTLDASAWTVTDDDDSDANTDEARAVASVAALDGDGAAVPAETATPAGEGGAPAAVAPALPAQGSRTSLLITHAALSSTASTPTVRYAAPAAPLSAGGAPVGTHTAEAADGAPAEVGAVTASARTVTVTFGEPVSGGTDARHWTVDGNGVAVPSLVLNAHTSLTLQVAADAALAADARPTVSYAAPTHEGAALLRDAAGNAVASRAPFAAADGIGPEATRVAYSGVAFLVTFSEGIRAPAGLMVDVTPQGGAAAATPATASGAVLTVSVGAGVTGPHEIAIPDTVTDAAGNARAASAATLEAVASPAVSALAVSVTDAGQGAPRTGANAHYASAGDTVTVSLEFDAAAAPGLAAPAITVPGAQRTPSETAMGDAGDSDAATWSHSFTVGAEDAGGTVEFSIAVRDASTMTTVSTLTQADLTSGSAAIVDVTPPALAAGNSLYTRTVYHPLAGGDARTADVAAGIGDTLWVVAVANEALATSANNDIASGAGEPDARPDIAFFAGTPSEAQATAVTRPDSGAFQYNYSRVIAAGDAEGPLEFSLTIRDRAGNEATLTHADLTSSAGDGSGYRAPVDSSVPRMVSAEVTSTSTLDVTLSETLPAGAATEAGHWSAVDSTLDPPVSAVITGAAVTGATVTLTHDAITETSFSPTVTYSGSGAASLHDAGRNALPQGSAVMAALVPRLSVVSVTFASQTQIDVEFDQDVEVGDASGWTLSGAASVNVVSASPRVIRVSGFGQAPEGVPMTLMASRDAVRGAAPPHLLLAQPTTVMDVTYYDPGKFRARTEAVGASTYVMAMFNADVTGTTRPGEWVVAPDPASAGTPATALHRLCGGSLAPAASIDVADICGDGSSNAIYIPYEPMRSSDTPSVRYAAPAGPGATPIRAGGQVLLGEPVTAADGIAPSFEAQTSSRRAVTVHFDEPVTGTPDASRWYHAPTSPTPPTASELDAAVAGGASFASARLTGDGMQVRLELPESYAPASGWGSADTAAVPGAIFYRVPDGAAADITDRSPAANALAGGTMDSAVRDAAPAEATALSVRILAGGASGTAKTGAFAHVAGHGDGVEVSITLSEPAFDAPTTAGLPTLRMYGQTAQMDLDADRLVATGTATLPSTLDSDGPIDFTATVFDGASAPNVAFFTRADLAPAPADVPRVDVVDPLLLGAFVTSPTSVELTFSEAITGTGMVRAAPGASVSQSDPAAALEVAPTGTHATAALSLAGGDYAFSFDESVTDLGGRGVAQAVVNIVGPEADLMTDQYAPVPVPGAYDRTIVAPAPRQGVPGPEPEPFRLVTDTLMGAPFSSTLTILNGDASLTIPEGTAISDLGGEDDGESRGTLLVELADRLADTAYVGRPDPSEEALLANERAATAITRIVPEILVTLGKRDDAQPVVFDLPVRVTLFGAARAEHVFYTASGLQGAAPDRLVSAIPLCAALGYDRAAESRPDFPPPVPPTRDAAGAVTAPASGLLDCHAIDGPDIVIWTNHFTQFGAAGITAGGGGGDGCDDCTPPTLGVDSTGTRRVSGGFTYNGDTVDAEYYYTPLPLITVETGEENAAVLRVFEDTGARNMRHVGLSFGLSRGQHFAEADAAIGVNIAHTGNHTITLDDPHGAIDTESLRADVETGECMAGSEAECLVVTIHHTFREPLEFNVVSTIVWDDRLNSWQNFFNHGVHVTGESLNPRHGIEVNGGALVLYPLIAGHADEDGDGVYDYDERHVTYMLDEGYRVYRLTPGGTYEPLRNLASLHHEVDERMWDESLMKTHGPTRDSPHFANALAEEQRIAAAIIGDLGVPPGNDMPVAARNAHDPEGEATRAERLRAQIAGEINAAELALQRLWPSLRD